MGLTDTNGLHEEPHPGNGELPQKLMSKALQPCPNGPISVLQNLTLS